MQLLVTDLGPLGYADALELQRAAARARISGTIAEDLLLLVEHPPVVTLGRGTRATSLTTPPAVLAARGVDVHEVDRGGDVTFHGPGQLVGYPIIDLKRHRQDLHWYLRQVEEAIIRALVAFGIPGERNAGFTGVWTQGRKLASIGVHARDWVTWHGFALNVTTDLSYFDLMVPCGIADVTMTSVAREMAADASDPAALGARVRAEIVGGFAAVFGLEPVPLDAAALRAALAAANPVLEGEVPSTT